MQETSISENSTKTTYQGLGILYLSMAFFLTIVISTLGLYILSYSKSKTIVTMKEELMQIDTSINEISKNPNIVIAKIIQENTLQSSIDLKKIVTQFRLAAIKANVNFEGFSIKDNTITTTLISTMGTTIHPDPVATIVAMMNEYMAQEGKEFQLGKITNIVGDATKRTTTINLKLLSNSNQ